MPTWGFAPVLVIGRAFALGGVALFRDYRGVASWHSAKTINLTWPLHQRTKRLPPWRWLPSRFAPTTRENAIRNQIRTERLIGAIFGIVGAIAITAGVVGLITRTT